MAPPTALRRYRPATTPEPGGWREANDTVARMGVWKSYLREAQQAEPAAASASAPSATTTPATTPAASAAHPSARPREHRHGPDRHGRAAATLLAALALTGCAWLSPDAGFDGVRDATRQLGGLEIAWARDDEARQRLDARLAQLLTEPLSMDAAVQVALLNNRHLQAAFEELGIANAERVQASRWPNPGFGFGRSTKGDEVEIERSLHLDIGRLLALPLIREVEARRFSRAQGQAASTVLQLAADTRKAWVLAVAAGQGVQYARQVMDAAEASAERLDVRGARLAIEQAARQLGLGRATRFVNVFELGLVRNTSNEAPTQKGWEIGFQIPLFDGGGARMAKAEGLYRQSAARAKAAAVDARSEVREAYGAYRCAWDMARHQRDERVPLARRISEENLLRYNGMLIGVFELLADARAQIATVHAAIDAERDFWLAQAELDMALIGKPGLEAAAAIAASMPTAAAGAAPH